MPPWQATMRVSRRDTRRPVVVAQSSRVPVGRPLAPCALAAPGRGQRRWTRHARRRTAGAEQCPPQMTRTSWMQPQPMPMPRRRRLQPCRRWTSTPRRVGKAAELSGTGRAHGKHVLPPPPPVSHREAARSFVHRAIAAQMSAATSVTMPPVASSLATEYTSGRLGGGSVSVPLSSPEMGRTRALGKRDEGARPALGVHSTHYLQQMDAVAQTMALNGY